MLSPLLIQLFGRDVIDHLGRSGFGTTEAIAEAGAERLEREAGLLQGLAQRIVAVAREARPPAPDEAPAPQPAAKRPRLRNASAGRSAGRRKIKIEPGRGDSPAAADEAGAVALAGSAAPAPEVEAPEAPYTFLAGDEEPEPWRGGEGEAFVDDSRLISWMGLAAKGGAGGALPAFTVADEILDPPPSPVPPEAAEETPDAVAEMIDSSPREPLRRSAALAGSFWSFGQRDETVRTIEPSKRPADTHEDGRRGTDADPGSPGPGVPRRRSHDGH